MRSFEGRHRRRQRDASGIAHCHAGETCGLSRSDIPESERVPHLLFAEEAQNFIGDFESILAETRKFNLVLAVATQGIESLSRETAAAIFTNAANLIAFRVSNTDAERLRDEFTMAFPARSFRIFRITKRG